jgi:hypothetical protein
MCIMVRQQQLSTLCLIMVYIISSSSFVFHTCLSSFFTIVTNLCIFMRLIESPHLRLFNSSTTAFLLPTHSTHTQPQQCTMQHYTINPAFKAFIVGVASVLFALWMVSNSLLKSVHSSLIPSQVKTHWWLLRHLRIPIRCRDA